MSVAAASKEVVLREVRAAFEYEPRINLHRFPIHVDFVEDDLVLEGEVENIAAKGSPWSLLLLSQGSVELWTG